MNNYIFQPTCQIPTEALDEIYRAAFGYKTDGTFVEIGAHDGWHWSCTWGLAEIGWRGLYAEPVPELYQECLKTNVHRPNVKTVRCCIGENNRETVTLFMGPYGASLDPAYSQSKQEITAPQMTLDHFLEENGIQTGFDLLVIDVEYAEAAVLAGFSVAKWRPELAIVETQGDPSIAAALATFGTSYDVVFHDWINTVYRRRP